MPGALRSLPTDTARAEAQLRAVGGVDKAEVNFGAERAVVHYAPDLVDVAGLTEAVATATGFPARLRPELGSDGTRTPRRRPAARRSATCCAASRSGPC
ncbi:MAG: heavy-metal-associated domain-containing protein [Actinomycetota bacterium]|nr:heavy-metal-associated domain-containing protein [Actinomycetota bacterium]